MFHFKQFDLEHERSTLKIGTDAVLLECKMTERRNNDLIARLKTGFRHIEVVRGGAVAIESISTSCR